MHWSTGECAVLYWEHISGIQVSSDGQVSLFFSKYNRGRLVLASCIWYCASRTQLMHCVKYVQCKAGTHWADFRHGIVVPFE